MSIPDYQTIMLPILRLTASQELSNSKCVDLIIDEFGLSPEEREQRLPSGQQTTISNRVQWAASYMVQAGLLERPRRGVITATALGRQILGENPKRIDNNFLLKFDGFKEFRKRSGQTNSGQMKEPDILSETEEKIETKTPEEKIENSFHVMNSALRKELLERITSSDPAFFEHETTASLAARFLGPLARH